MTDLVALEAAVDNLSTQSTGLIDSSTALQNGLDDRIAAAVLEPILTVASSFVKLSTTIVGRGT